MRENTILDIIHAAKKAADILYTLNAIGIIDEDPSLKNINFKDSRILLNKLEEKLHINTHEIGSELRFTLQNIEVLLAFIQFQQRHHLLTEEDLEIIIDKQPTIPEQKLLINKIVKDKKHWKEGIDYINQLKTDWNKTFSNKSFQKIKRIIIQ